MNDIRNKEYSSAKIPKEISTMTSNSIKTSPPSNHSNGEAIVKAGKSTPTRYSILSDPRLSQLFALSSQLEALADTCEMEPNSSLIPLVDTMPLNTKQGGCIIILHNSLIFKHRKH